MCISYACRYKDRKLIRSGRHYNITYEDRMCVLTLQDAFPEDEGHYMCRALNEAGSVTTESRLKVQSKLFTLGLINLS